jgi:transposase
MVQRRGGCWLLPWCSKGADRKSAAETCGMDRQTLRDWVHRYNAEGLRGLHDLKTPGPKSKLTAEQQAELTELVEAGPDPAHHGVVRWRRVDLRDELELKFFRRGRRIRFHF